jgi:hypothetical protein
MFMHFSDDEPKHKLRLAPEVQHVFFPCSIMDNHWSLLVLSLASKTFTLWDPLVLKPDHDMMDNVRYILKGFCALFNIDGQQFEVRLQNNCNHQKQGTFNCGAHVCYFLQQLCTGQEIDAAKDMEKYREYMRTAILLHIQPNEKEQKKDEQRAPTERRSAVGQEEQMGAQRTPTERRSAVGQEEQMGAQRTPTERRSAVGQEEQMGAQRNPSAIKRKIKETAKYPECKKKRKM